MSASDQRPLEKALEHLAAGEWQQAHEIVQNEKSELAAWLHGIVHILEGDLKNAQGWYRRANRPFPGGDAAQAEIAAARLQVSG
jgi:exopolyphosphatase/pppGpp-phosphohydrolase